MAHFDAALAATDAVAHFDAALAATDAAVPRFDELRPEFAAKHAETKSRPA